VAVDDDDRQRRRVEDRLEGFGGLAEALLEDQLLLGRGRLLLDHVRHGRDREDHDERSAEADGQKSM
jgi:hypothetical protein